MQDEIMRMKQFINSKFGSWCKTKASRWNNRHMQSCSVKQFIEQLAGSFGTVKKTKQFGVSFCYAFGGQFGSSCMKCG